MSKVAIQGYRGSFHHIVAEGLEGGEVEILACDTFREVVQAVEQQRVDYGIMAIENSIAGSILPNYNLLQSCNVHITDEVYLPIRQNLMVNRGVLLEDISEVESHQMALLQCSDYLDKHKWQLIESVDTALSAAQIRESGSRSKAVIASTLAAEIFDLDIVAHDIHTNSDNCTRFLRLEYADRTTFEPTPCSNDGKASLYIKISNTPGSLYEALGCFEGLDLNMTKLQSCPLPSEPWHYIFHIDMEFARGENFTRAVERLRELGVEVHIYGIYKRGRELK
jgi:prephenate dehydratase